jgi:two-component system OmpR family response regulator
MAARIVVADDSRMILELVVMSLKRDGYEPVTATDGSEALAAIREHRPELVIIDGVMPNGDGYEVCETIRAEQGDWKPHVILLTAADRPVDRERALAAGADELMSKPFSTSELRSRVRELLGDQPSA